MAEYADREHFIPLRRSEVVDLLCKEPGLPREEAEQFRQFCTLLSATYHYHYYQKLESLKADYAPFDPDADTQTLKKLSPEERQKRLNELYRDFAWLLERANFKHINCDELQRMLDEHSEFGLRMAVNFGVFEHLAIFARGDSRKKMFRPKWWGWWRSEEVQVPIFQRLVLILKLRKHRWVPRNADLEKVYLKVFKDIPKMDVKMLLPTARVQLTYTDRGKIGLPLLTGIGMAAWKLVAALGWALMTLLDDFTSLFGFIGNPMAAFWAVATGAVGYGTKSYFAYQGTRQRYHLTLTESLYFGTLDSNAGVLFRLLDEAEEQECREAILAYFFLWRYAGDNGWTAADLDDYIELHLERYAKLKVDFEIGDAMEKLEKARLVEKRGDRYVAIPIAKALEVLDWAWDNYFKYNNPEYEAPPV